MAEEDKKQLDEEREMSFVEHLDELRKHIIRSVLAIVVCAVFVFAATKWVFQVILFGPLRADFPTYRLLCWASEKVGLGDALCYTPVNVDLQTFDMGEAFFLHLKVCFMGGLAIAFPYILYQLWSFIRPGLYDHEQKNVRGIVAVGSLLFALGACFGYFVLSPFAVNFLAGYQLPMINQVDAQVTQMMTVCSQCCEGAAAMVGEMQSKGGIIKATSFINYMIMFTIPVGLVFEMPIIIYYLAKVGIVTPAGMRKYRRHAVVLILILAAVVTPPDIITQVIVGIPMYILYELSIGIAARQAKRYEEQEKEREANDE